MQADLKVKKVSESALMTYVLTESTGALFHNVFQVTEH